MRYTSTAFVALAAIAAIAALAGTAAAQEQDPVILPPVNIGGYVVSGSVVFAGAYHPNPMIPGTEISSDGGPVETESITVNGLRVCEVDDGIDLPGEENDHIDLIECDARVLADVANPCAGIHATIDESDVLDFALSDAIGGTADAIDGNLDPVVGPTLAQYGVQNAEWGDRAHSAVYDCAGDAPPVTGDVAGEASEIIISIGNPYYCSPFFCPGEIDIATTYQDSTEPFEQTPYLGSAACDFRGTVVDCGEVELAEDVVIDTREITSSISEALPDGGSANETLTAPGFETPSAVIGEYFYDTGSLLRCGVRSQTYGDTFARLIPVVGLGIAPAGSGGALEGQRKLGEAMGDAAEDYNTLMAEVLAQWGPLNVLASETLRGAMQAYFDAWPVVDDVYGPESPVRPANASTQDGCTPGSPPAPPAFSIGSG